MARQFSLQRIIQDMIAEHLAQLSFPEPGIVVSVDPSTYTVKVQLIYDNLVTGPLRVMAARAGNDFGDTELPDHGDEVMVVFQGGRLQDGYVIGGLYNLDDSKAPAFTFGDRQYKHKSGSMITFSLNGDVSVISSSGTKLFLGADGSWSVTGNDGKLVQMDTAGRLTTNTGIDGDNQAVVLKAFLAFFDQHVQIDGLGLPTSPPTILTTVTPNLASDGT